MSIKKPFLEKLKQRFRLVLFDEQSYEELWVSSLSWIQLLFRALSALLLISIITAAMISFTSLREYIPGYSPPKLSKDLLMLSLKTDSLIQEIQLKEQKFKILEKIIKGEDFNDSINFDMRSNVVVNSKDLIASSKDSIFRESIEREGRFNVLSEEVSEPLNLLNTVFYSPIKGLVTSSFNLKENHYGVDVVAAENEGIKACLSGTVILSDWTSETGYILAIQHQNELISFYKHNSVLLKKTGELVKAGDVIAIIGNSGKYTSGPHLHFELWHRGKAINPEEHILF